VSGALVRHTRPGDEIVIGPPLGTMTPDGIDNRDLVCVAQGIGLAPVKAIAEKVLEDDEAAVAGGHGHRRRVTLFHGADDPFGLYDAPYFDGLTRRYPWFRFVGVVSGDPGFAGPQGNVTDVALNWAHWEDRDAFVSGPLQMVTGTVSRFRDAGLPADRVHFDRLETPHR
jgi:NAD(P)H-flavin reductase